MEPELYRPILRRVGTILILVGLLDIGWMIYCIVNGISYSSSLNIFAVIAGIFLLRGGLRTAAIVRWFAIFYLSSFAAALILAVPVVPAGLMLTCLRLYTVDFCLAAGAAALVLLFGAWVVRELSSAPVQAAIASGHLAWRSMRIPAVLGVAVVGLVAGLMLYLVEDHMVVERATKLARHEVGPGYNLFVDSVHIHGGGDEMAISADVVAWKGNEIREIPVNWTE
ncbi:MAG: hypothetical protein ABSD74_01755 [Rhizomicrobium sp.]|jgi:hypothetical protein